MYTDINGVNYKLEGDKAIIQSNSTSIKIEIFPTITIEDKTYEVMFPDNCEGLFKNNRLQQFLLHKLIHETTNITNCKEMFYDCRLLKELDISNFNTENVTTMNNMFYGCSNLCKLDVSNFNTKNVINMCGMFQCASHIKELDLSNFNTKNIMNLSFMFYGCRSINKITLFNFNTKNIQSVVHMFCGCEQLQQIDLSNFVNPTGEDLLFTENMILASYQNNIKIDKSNSYMSDVNCNNTYKVYKPLVLYVMC